MVNYFTYKNSGRRTITRLVNEEVQMYQAPVQSLCPFSLLSFQGYDAINKSKNPIQEWIDGYYQCSFRQEVPGKWLLGHFLKEIILVTQHVVAIHLLFNTSPKKKQTNKKNTSPNFYFWHIIYNHLGFFFSFSIFCLFNTSLLSLKHKLLVAILFIYESPVSKIMSGI